MKETFKKHWGEFQTFCSYSSIHGLGYLHTCRNLGETIIWIVSVCVALGYACILIISTFQAWDDNPVATFVTTLSQDIRSVQYPTITICPPVTVKPWNLPRIWLNTFPFKCESNEECANNSIRHEFKEFLEEIPQFVQLPKSM